MIKTLTTRGGPPLHASVLVAFDRNTGRVLGTFVDYSHAREVDGAAASRTGDRFIADLRAQHGNVLLDSVRVAPEELDQPSLQRVDPGSGKLVRVARSSGDRQSAENVLLRP